MTRAGLSAGQGGDHGAGTHIHPAVWGARLARILESQRDLCTGLEAMSRRQAELIAAGDTDGLLGVLGERQGLVDEVAKLSEELEPLRAVWDRSASLLAPEIRGRVAGLVEEIGGLMEKINARDEADRVSLEQRRAVVAKELGEISRGRGALAAYGAASGGYRAAASLGGAEDRRG
jgi:hypothetical protein